MSIIKRMFALLTLFGVCMGAVRPVVAQDTAFNAKQIRLIIGQGAGGGYDQYGRLVARFIGKYLPGNPSIVPQNIPGAGSITAANTIYNLSPKDGSVFGIIYRDVVTAQLIDEKSGAKFDPLKLIWVGSAAPETNVCAATDRSPVRKLDDLRDKQLVVGGTGAGAGSELYPKILNNILGFKFKVVGGYNGAAEAFLAMDRGEIDGYCAAYSVFQVIEAQNLASGKLRVLFQAGLKPNPSIKAPFLLDVVHDEQQRKLLEFAYGGQTIGWPFVAPPDLPSAIRSALRAAFDATMKDPELRQEAEKQKLTIDPIDGAELETMVRTIVTTPPAIVDKVRAILAAG